MQCNINQETRRRSWTPAEYAGIWRRFSWEGRPSVFFRHYHIHFQVLKNWMLIMVKNKLFIFLSQQKFCWSNEILSKSAESKKSYNPEGEKILSKWTLRETLLSLLFKFLFRSSWKSVQKEFAFYKNSVFCNFITCVTSET